MGYAYMTCLGCGKRGYYSKRTAKKEMRAHSMTGMCVYKCQTSPTELWHWGHLPLPVKAGRMDRANIGRTTRRSKPPRRAPK